MSIAEATLTDLDARKAEYWHERPAPLSHIDFARTLTVPDSENDRGVPDPYEPSSHPGQLVFLQAMDGMYDRPGSRFLVFVFIGDAQGAGKSWLLQQTAFHDMVERGQNVIYGLPTRDLGGDIWSLKLRPAITGAGLEMYLPTSGPGSKDGSKPRFVPFKRINGKGGGTLVFMAAGGRGQSGQAALTAKKLLVDEVEDWAVQALTLIKKRISKNNQTAIQIYACTINKNNDPDKEDDASRIQPLYDASTRGRMGYTCPHCRAITRLEPERFAYEGKTMEEWKATAKVFCSKCDAAISQEQRLEMFGHGTLITDDPTATTFGLRLTALDCPWKPLHWLAELHHSALLSADSGDHEPMRQLFNKEWSCQYAGDRNLDERAEKISPKYLLRRSDSNTAWGEVQTISDREGTNDKAPRTHSRHIAPMPTGAQWSIVTIDIQADRLYWLLMAGDSQGRTYDVAWAYEHATFAMADMDKFQLWAVLDRIDGISRQITGDIPRVYAGVDANFRTDEVLDWLKLHNEWWPLYGASARKAAKMRGKEGERVEDAPGILYLRRSDGWKLRQARCHIDTNPMRMAAQRTFLLKPGEPHAAHLPHGLTSGRSDMTYLRHLCGEQWDEKALKWVEQPASRWDWLDCRTYAMALHRYHMLKLNRPRKSTIKYGVIGKVTA